MKTVNSVTLVDMRLHIELKSDKTSSFVYFGDKQFQVLQVTQINVLKHDAGLIAVKITDTMQSMETNLTYSGQYLIDWQADDEDKAMKISQVPMDYLKRSVPT